MALTPVHQQFSTVPAAAGLYDPRNEKDACGLAMVATLRGTPGHDIVDAALGALRNLEHRGARSPTRSSAPSSTSSCPRPGSTPSASRSSRPTNKSEPS
jgi:glutamate synthase (NADPH/NADH) large chain